MDRRPDPRICAYQCRLRKLNNHHDNLERPRVPSGRPHRPDPRPEGRGAHRRAALAGGVRRATHRGQIRRQRHGRRTPEAVLRRGHGLPAPGGPAPGCGARGRPADLADARRAGHRIGVPRRTARHHARGHGRGAHGAHRQGLARAGRPDQRARPVRRRPVRRGRRPVLRHAAQAGHRRPGHRHRPGGRCGERGRVGRRGPDQRRTHPRGLLGRAERGRRHAGAQRQRRFGRRRPGRGARRAQAGDPDRCGRPVCRLAGPQLADRPHRRGEPARHASRPGERHAAQDGGLRARLGRRRAPGAHHRRPQAAFDSQ